MNDQRQSGTPTVAIAFGGGGARGLAHIHVIEALDEMGITPVAITGSSIGAIMGAGMAAGMRGAEIRDFTLATVGRLDFWHRETALVVLLLTAAIGVMAWKRHPHERPVRVAAAAVAGLVLAQIALGLVMAYVALTPAAQIAHLTSSSLLLAAETVLLLLVRWLPGSSEVGGYPSLHLAEETRHASIS